MSVAIQYAAKFYLDFAEVVNFLVDRDAVNSASRFVAAVAETIERIGESPEIGEKLYVKRIRQSCRLRQVRRFRRYAIVFRRLESGVLIMRLVRGSRDLPNRI